MKRRSNEEFQLYLRAMLGNDNLKVKYQNPMAWRPSNMYSYV